MDGAGITDSLITTLNVEENASLVARIYERELARMKARVKEEIKRHSLLTASSRVTGNINIEKLVKLLEFNPIDLSVDTESE